MTNLQTQVDGIEAIGIDVAAGFNHPDLALTFARKFGFGGSTSRSTTLLTALMAYFQVQEETGNVPTPIGTGATTTTANTSILPANSLIVMIGWRVKVAIPTATSWSLGSAGQATRFGTGLSVGLNASGICIDHWNPANAAGAGVGQTAAAGLLITPNALPGAGGQIAFQVLTLTGVPPTA